MIEGIIMFIIGFACGKYTDQIVEYCKKYFNKKS